MYFQAAAPIATALAVGQIIKEVLPLRRIVDTSFVDEAARSLGN